MKSKNSGRKTRAASKQRAVPRVRGGRTRAPDAPLDKALVESFVEVEPAGFQDNPRSSIAAAVADPDVDDSEGGE